MTIKENPFYVLGATPRDSRQKIQELVEEKELELDTSICSEAKMVLVNPRKRLSAEISWFPGVSIRQINTIVKSIEKDTIDPENIGKLSSVAGFNAMLAYLLSGVKLTPKQLENAIFDLAKDYDDIKSEQVMKIINEDRSISGFPEVTELSQINEEILALKDNAIHEIQKLVAPLSFERMNKLMLNLVERALKEETPCKLLDDIIDKVYVLEVQKNIDNIRSNITKGIEDIKKALSHGASKAKLKSMVEPFLEELEKFDDIMQPIQLSTQKRGLEHNLTKEVAYEVRSLSIALGNKGHLELDEMITAKMNKLFVEVGSIEELTSRDLRDITKISQQKKDEEKEMECSFKHTDGWGNEQTLSISAKKGISYGDKTFKLDEITRIRYGAKLDSGEVCTLVGFGNDEEEVQIKWLEASRYSIDYPYNKFIKCLWTAVGGKILDAMLNHLAQGKSLYGVVFDNKVRLEKRTYYGDGYSAGDEKFFKWSDIGVDSSINELTIYSHSEPSYKKEFTLSVDENAVVLAILLKVFLRESNGGQKSISECFNISKAEAKKGKNIDFPDTVQSHSEPMYNVGKKVGKFMLATWWIWFWLIIWFISALAD